MRLLEDLLDFQGRKGLEGPLDVYPAPGGVLFGVKGENAVNEDKAKELFLGEAPPRDDVHAQRFFPHFSSS